ncbi:tyrosine-type recombinase/integrase [Pleionea sediminis]|uniref:tyrosine-type recombinase/integrase n=1 Tax=Pleionea sediminis TaxID=2569479 RepID=UPI001185C8AF|nr:tyrosine-type recombinase/integrase [Pleionea sediminis]
MTKLPAGIQKLPTGIRLHGDQILIDFQYQGTRCREPLSGIGKINKSTIQYAVNKRNSILVEIKEGRFDYSKHFPNSKKDIQITGYNGPELNRSVRKAVHIWLNVKKVTKAKSTYRNYVHKSKHVVNEWGDRPIRNITKSDILLFQAKLLKKLQPKTVNDIFIIVRGIWSDAFYDDIIKSNLPERIENIPIESDNEPDPFTNDELERIAGANTHRIEDVNMIMFNCWTGLSVSELAALAWEDVDTVNWTIKISRARVEDHYKVPKEKSRVRTIELIEPAKYWLKKQLEYTYMLDPNEIYVFQRDNVRKEKQNIRFVFFNRYNDLPYSPASFARWFESHLKKAKVRHRGPNQCRHTFASKMITNYVPLEWVARQLGHTDTSMIKKHYGKIIPGDTPSMAGIVSNLLGFKTNSENAKTPRFVTNLSQEVENKAVSLLKPRT